MLGRQLNRFLFEKSGLSAYEKEVEKRSRRKRWKFKNGAITSTNFRPNEAIWKKKLCISVGELVFILAPSSETSPDIISLSAWIPRPAVIFEKPKKPRFALDDLTRRAKRARASRDARTCVPRSEDGEVPFACSLVRKDCGCGCGCGCDAEQMGTSSFLYILHDPPTWSRLSVILRSSTHTVRRLSRNISHLPALSIVEERRMKGALYAMSPFPKDRTHSLLAENLLALEFFSRHKELLTQPCHPPLYYYPALIEYK
ncbi:hypothetical protein HZH68_010652 [Vespula germanica]|uniref:Uncharacterized protein n=1 Tax=Vespula germanica TaxID=30212 RepID=A0A834JS90_VESGE|nr:hypothetical protein HZH68_010652 [Vespula germanica]